MSNIRSYLLLLAFLLCATLLPAQRVAVVFSGGGAKGLVHLGTLKALEENQIPIDAIAGTSIGAIIGGMYAAGYSVDEMVTYLSSGDFKKWSTGNFVREGQYYYKQLGAGAEMFTIHMNIDHKWRTKIVLPTNLVLPYQMDFAFMQLFAGATAAAKGNLDSLMIPFRAMSYDAYNKHPYSPSRGDVAMLIRASMSFPGIFKPAVIDSMLLFDGGMINNFPVNVVEEEFSPDFIVGVKCTDNYERPTEDDVFSHLTSLMSRPTGYEVDSSRGVLVNIDLQNVSLMDFAKLKGLMDIGYRETMKVMPEIKRRVQQRVSKEEINRKRFAFRQKIPPFRFDSVSVRGVHEGLETYIKGEMLSESSSMFSLQQVKSNFFRVVSDDAVTTFYPTARYCETDSAYNLDIRATSAPNVKLLVGGCFANYSNLGFLGGEYQRFSTYRLRVGANVYFGNVYNSQKVYARIDTRIKKWDRPLFYELNATHNTFDRYSNNPDLIFSDTRPDFLQDNEFFGELNVGTRFLYNSVLRLGFSGGVRGANYYSTTNFASDDIPERMRFSFLSGNLSIERNSLNYNVFPTRGTVERISLNYIWGGESHTQGTTAVDFDSMKLNKKAFLGYRNFWVAKYMRQDYILGWKNFALGYHIEGVYSPSLSFSDYYSRKLMLPSFEPLPNLQGFFLENFRANTYVAGGLIPTFLLSERVYLRTEAYAFLPLKTVKMDESGNSVNTHYQFLKFLGAATLVVNTPVGPLAASLSYYDKPNQNIYFSVSFGYNLYNKRAFNN